MIIGRVERAIWDSYPPKPDGSFIAAIRWDDGEWVLAEQYAHGATLIVSHWMPAV